MRNIALIICAIFIYVLRIELNKRLMELFSCRRHVQAKLIQPVLADRNPIRTMYLNRNSLCHR